MGMTTKSESNISTFFWNLSPYLSGVSDNNGQNVVSNSLIFKVPQMLRRTQSWKQSLLCLDGRITKTKKKNTNKRLKVTCESDSHFLSSFNRFKSRMGKLPKLLSWKLMLLKTWGELYLTWAPCQINDLLVTHDFVDRLSQRRVASAELKDAKRLIQHDFEKVEKTHSKGWHCISVRVLQRLPVKFLYVNCEPLTFIVVVIWWINPISGVESSKNQGWTELKDISKSRIKNSSDSWTHSLYYIKQCWPSNALGKKLLLTVNSPTHFWTSIAINMPSVMFKPSCRLWIEIFRIVNFFHKCFH